MTLVNSKFRKKLGNLPDSAESLIRAKPKEYFLKKQLEYVSELKKLAEELVADNFSNRYKGDIYETCKRYMAEGKFWREASAIEAYRGTGGRDLFLMSQASLLITALHSGSLMQDDVFDGDLERHGGPTMHIVFQKEFEKRFAEKKNSTDSIDYGRNQAILLSQYTALLGLNVIRSLPVPISTQLGLVKLWHNGYQKSAVGEMKDLSYAGRLGELTINDWECLVMEKSAPFPDAAIKCGLTMSGAIKDKRIVKGFEGYVTAAVLAFQARDDYLAMYGDPTTTGKSNTTDILRGSPNRFLISAYQKATDHDRRKLDSIVGRGPAQTEEETNERCENVREIVRKYALEEGQEYTQSCVESALQHLGEIPGLADESKLYFEGAAIFGAEREK